MNTQPGLGSRPKSKLKTIGITLNKVYMMNTFNKKSFLKPKKQKIWKPKSNISWWGHNLKRISRQKLETNNIRNGNKISWLVQVFIEWLARIMKTKTKKKTEWFWWFTIWNRLFWMEGPNIVLKWGPSRSSKTQTVTWRFLPKKGQLWSRNSGKEPKG